MWKRLPIPLLIAAAGLLVLPYLLLGVVLWIGGVGFVTTVLLPAVQRTQSAPERLALFHRIERRFAWQARATTLLAGVTGFWMTHRLGVWGRFADPAFWWMHAMVLVWAVFTLMLFVLEPLVLHRWLEERSKRDPVATFALKVEFCPTCGTTVAWTSG